MVQKIRPQQIRVHPDFQRMLYEIKAEDPKLTFVKITEKMVDKKDLFKTDTKNNKKEKGPAWLRI